MKPVFPDVVVGKCGVGVGATDTVMLSLLADVIRLAGRNEDTVFLFFNDEMTEQDLHRRMALFCGSPEAYVARFQEYDTNVQFLTVELGNAVAMAKLIRQCAEENPNKQIRVYADLLNVFKIIPSLPVNGNPQSLVCCDRNLADVINSSRSIVLRHVSASMILAHDPRLHSHGFSCLS